MEANHPTDNQLMLSFEQHIKPLFRDSDRDAMLKAFDLWSYEDVVANGEAISARLADGTMPCDAPWADGNVSLFDRWLAEGAAK